MSTDLVAFDALLEPILRVLATLDPSAPDAAATLAARFPVDGPAVRAIADAFAEGVRAGWLCQREGGPSVRYSRVRKATTPGAFSVDAVRMEGDALGHTHPNGEIDLCIATAGTPRFDGHPPGWVVYAPGTWHVPSVADGAMDILYFLPGGAIEFGPKRA